MIALFLVLEVFARVLWHPMVIGERLYTRFSPVYDYGFDATQPIWFKSGNRIEFVPTQYLNFRGHTLPYPKPDNAFRIFTLGSSVSRSGADTNYSYFLKQALETEHPERDWTVTNLSADGIGSLRIMLMLQKIMPLSPDLVILHVHGSNEYEDERDALYQRQLHQGLSGILFQSRLIVLMKKIYGYMTLKDQGRVWDAEEEIRANEDPANWEQWLQSIDRNTARMIQLCTKHQVPVILVGRAEKREGLAGFDSELVRQVDHILKAYQEPGVTFFNTSKKFFEYHPEPRGKALLFTDEAHWTGEGHRVIAQQLLKHLFSFAFLK